MLRVMLVKTSAVPICLRGCYLLQHSTLPIGALSCPTFLGGYLHSASLGEARASLSTAPPARIPPHTLGALYLLEQYRPLDCFVLDPPPLELRPLLFKATAHQLSWASFHIHLSGPPRPRSCRRLLCLLHSTCRSPCSSHFSSQKILLCILLFIFIGFTTLSAPVYSPATPPRLRIFFLTWAYLYRPPRTF